MYCKHCGHREDGRFDRCPNCDTPAVARIEIGTPQRGKPRWHVVLAAIAVVVVTGGFAVRTLARPELETIGPTDKLRFLRALDRSEYRRVGQIGFQVEGSRLKVQWDLRWTALTESKQREIVSIVGRAWAVVGGGQTELWIEGEDSASAVFDSGDVRLRGAR